MERMVIQHCSKGTDLSHYHGCGTLSHCRLVQDRWKIHGLMARKVIYQLENVVRYTGVTIEVRS